MGTAVQLGHVKGVSEQLAYATAGAFDQLEKDLGNALDDPAFAEFQDLKGVIKKHAEKLGTMSLELNHDRPKFEGNKISSGKVIFETDQFSLIGEGRQDNVGKDWENAAGQAVNVARNEIVKIIISINLECIVSSITFFGFMSSILRINRHQRSKIQKYS